MSDTVQVIMILCVTYVVGLIITKRRGGGGR